MLWSSVSGKVSIRGRLTTASEVAVIDVAPNLTLLKCPVFHARLSVLLISAAFLSERTKRPIRVGTKLIVIDVSELHITLKFPGKFTLSRSCQMPRVSETFQVR